MCAKFCTLRKTVFAGAEAVDRYENNFNVRFRDLEVLKEGSLKRGKYIKFLVIGNEDGEDAETAE